MRLIDADMFEESLKQAQNECRRKEGGNFLFGFLSKVRANLEKMPTVDAVPVKHGVWKECKDGTLDCSVCHCIAPYEENYYGDVLCASVYDYCPNCGAKMEGVEKWET